MIWASSTHHIDVLCASYATHEFFLERVVSSLMQVSPQYKMRFIGWHHLNWWPIKRYSLYVFEIEERSSTCLLFFRPLSFALQLLACMTERVLECPPGWGGGAKRFLLWNWDHTSVSAHYTTSIFGHTLQLYGNFMKQIEAICMHIPATDNGGDFCSIFRKQITSFIK